ncbi:hypothetical protein [Pseudoxanthomonas mexicana]|uniref:hypothetical protein n=1 Tax=Pseudoxanthomonas mexicana TaxID=128785 RepID=UPI0024E1C12A|nr:hypothetical protein [Pseudoxanthomonas mexicana]
MKVHVASSHPNDQLYLVRSSEFMGHVDERDLALRESEVVEDCYHTHWFNEAVGGQEFNVPVVTLRRGKFFFINGRHRSVVLSRHAQEMPIAIAAIDVFGKGTSPESTSAMHAVVLRALASHDLIALPDLPVRYMGFDANIGK